MDNFQRKPRPETDREEAIWREASEYGRPAPGVSEFDKSLFASAVFALLFLGLCWLSVNYTANHHATTGTFVADDIPPAVFGIDALVHPVPDGRGNYRSGSLTADELRTVLATGKIKYVLRLNGDGKKDRGPLSCAEERAIVEAAGVVYVTSPSTPHRFDAKAGYRKGRGYVGAFDRASHYYRRGGCLTKCRHNYDRTGSLIGAWLAANDLPPDLILAHNKWDATYPDRSEGHARNWETVAGQMESDAK